MRGCSPARGKNVGKNAMTRAFLFGLACLVFTAQALAQDKAKKPNAAALIGKTLSPDKQNAIADHATMAKSGGWTFRPDLRRSGPRGPAWPTPMERRGGAVLTVPLRPNFQALRPRRSRRRSPSAATSASFLKGETGIARRRRLVVLRQRRGVRRRGAKGQARNCRRTTARSTQESRPRRTRRQRDAGDLPDG